MANMKNVALIDAAIAQAKAEGRADIEALLAVIEDELAPMQGEIERLRADVETIKNKRG